MAGPSMPTTLRASRLDPEASLLVGSGGDQRDGPLVHQF